MEAEKVKIIKSLYTRLDYNISLIDSLETFLKTLINQTEDHDLSIIINIPEQIRPKNLKRAFITFGTPQRAEELPKYITDILEQVISPDYRIQLHSTILQVKFLTTLRDLISEENEIIKNKIKSIQ